MQNPTDQEIKNDVLHASAHTTLSPEEIAKARERHQKAHPDKKQTGSPAKMHKSAPKR